jgi:hypothetical protein
MGSIIRRLAPGRRGLTEANRTRLRPFDDRENILALLKLPDELMRQARRHRNPSNVPTVYIDRNGQTQGVPLPYGMTPDQREETIAKIRDMQQLNQG